MSPQELTVAGLVQWALAGAHWRVVDVSDERVRVQLCECTGAEVDLAESRDRCVIEWLRERPTDLESELTG